MKTKLYYVFLALCVSLCALGITSCDNNDGPGANVYNIGLAGSSSHGNYLAFKADVQTIESAVVAEFGGMSFEIQGKSDSADKEVKTRFEKAMQNVTLKGGWTGYVIYDVTKYTTSGSGSKDIASKKFISPDGE